MVIPIYKVMPDTVEKISLGRVLNVLKLYDIIFVYPKSLSLNFYLDFFEGFNFYPNFKSFNDDYFNGIAGYNKLMLSYEFYERFAQYDYMLLYQLDAIVFSDQLDYWCDQGYDYIGAPWFEHYGENNSKFRMSRYAGNGGLSLRKVDSTLELLRRAEGVQYNPLKEQKFLEKRWYLKAFFMYLTRRMTLREAIDRRPLFEDAVISKYLPDYFSDYRVAPPDVASKFAFECYPSYLYKINNDELPFGCHAFLRHEPEFWEEVFDAQGIPTEMFD